jgi:hypothetical protein
MKEILVGKLLEYIRDNNPDLLFELEAEDKLRFWLYTKAESIEPLWVQMQEQEQPDNIIEQTCLAELTKGLRPSRFNYIVSILGQDFQSDYSTLQQTGLLRHEVVNMIAYCNPVFDDLKFSEENEDNRFIQYAITGTIAEYLDSSRVSENVSNELQQSAETAG